MKVLIVGAGGQGGSCASILARQDNIEEIRIVDLKEETAKAIADLHRHDNVVNRFDVGINRRNDGINDGINSSNDVINDVIKFTEKEEIAVKALVRDPRLSAARLADLIGVKQRQAQRIITSLKNKAGLKRRGARKNGEWYFEGVAK